MNFGYCQINLVFRLCGMWRYLHNDDSWASVPRLGFIRSEEHKTEWPLTLEQLSEDYSIDADYDATEGVPPDVVETGSRSRGDYG